MSLLEDLFLEDEAGEAQELERVLEGGGDEYYEERPVSPNSDNNEERDDEAVEDRRRVDPTNEKKKRIIKNPRFVLNPARLTGPRGIQVIPDHYKDFKFKGKGHEKEDLDMVLKKLEHWAYRLYPKFAFHDCLKKIETLGKKRPVMVHLTKIRSDQLISEETVVQKDSSEDEGEAGPPEQDEFDKLLQQQIELARSTPAPGSVKKPSLSTPCIDRSHIMPKASSSPSISDEQRERMLRSRRMAEERRLAKLRNDHSTEDVTADADKTVEKTTSVDLTGVAETYLGARKHNKSNVIDSSDEDEASVVNNSITVDVDINIETRNIPEITNVIERVTNRSNINSSDEEAGKDNNASIDLTNIPEKSLNVIESRHNRFNVIDSSDEDEDVLVNKSVTIDNIDVRNHKVSENEEMSAVEINTEVNKENNDFDNLINSLDNEKDNCVMISGDDTESINDYPMKSTDNIHINNVVGQHKENESIKTGTIQPTTNDVEEVNDKNNEMNSNNISKEKLSENNDKENVDSNIADEIMDVDFSDDF